jgi:hypothetical protein
MMTMRYVSTLGTLTFACLAALGLAVVASACGPLCLSAPPCDEREEPVDDDGDGCIDRCLTPPNCDPGYACNSGDRPLTGDEGCGEGGVCYDRDVCGMVVTCSGPAYTQCATDDDCNTRCNTEDYCDPPFEIDGNWECLGRCEVVCDEEPPCNAGDRVVDHEDDCDEAGGCYEVMACGERVICLPPSQG